MTSMDDSLSTTSNNIQPSVVILIPYTLTRLVFKAISWMYFLLDSSIFSFKGGDVNSLKVWLQGLILSKLFGKQHRKGIRWRSNSWLHQETSKNIREKVTCVVEGLQVRLVRKNYLGLFSAESVINNHFDLPAAILHPLQRRPKSTP